MALDPQAWDEVCRRRAAGESIRALADAFGMSAATLARKLAASDAAKTAPPEKPKPARKRPSRPAASQKAPTAKRSKAKASAKPGSASGRRTQPAVTARRQLIARLYRAIDTKLKLMERRMNSEIDAIDAGSGAAPPGDANTSSSAGRNSADHERETRAFGALVKTINSVRQMQAELDTIANAHTAHAASSSAPSDADARLAADADRYRRDIAQRLAKFVPPQS